MNPFIRWLIPLGALAVLGVAFPPFSLRSRAAVELERAAAQFSAEEFVRRFWETHLTPSRDRAHEAAAVLGALAGDPARACREFGRTLGIGGACTFYLRGSGRVVGVTADEVRLAVAGGGSGDVVDVIIPLGLVFGNAVRDGTGLLEASVFPNAQQFNEVAAELNAIVEAKVLPELQRVAQNGARIEFVGCAEWRDDAKPPLRLVPVWVQREE
jgi:predicted lipoprotein